MDISRSKQVSKFLSLVLRHQPELIGIALDDAGWTPVDPLLQQAAAHGVQFSLADLREIVATSDKQRFALSEDGRLIRANQGHSVTVDLQLQPLEPPPTLYHGTVERFLDSIRLEGLIKGKRHHVHLSPDEPTAAVVGQRRGRPVILRVDAGRMRRDGHLFYRSENGVWLTDHVPPQYLEFPEPV
jgi:putative RNA 2'-phosphotransferase